MSETRVIPESLDLKALHERRNGGIAAVPAIIRALPVPDDLTVHLHVTYRHGKGLTSLRLILQPRECEQVILMLEEALMLIGGRDA